MAQLVARFHGMEEVRGSIPLISTRLFLKCVLLVKLICFQEILSTHNLTPESISTFGGKMFASILSNTLLAISVGAIFTATTPGTLAAATFVAGFSIISWGMGRSH